MFKDFKIDDKKTVAIRRNFGQVCFFREEDAEAAVEWANKQPKLAADFHQEERKSESCGLYIKNFPTKIEEQKLLSLFEKHGTIASHNFPKHPNGALKGYGYVNYESNEECAKAIQALNEMNLEGKTLGVEMAKSKQ